MSSQLNTVKHKHVDYIDFAINVYAVKTAISLVLLYAYSDWLSAYSDWLSAYSLRHFDFVKAGIDARYTCTYTTWK